MTLNRAVYERLKLHCSLVGKPMAALVEDLIRSHLDSRAAEVPRVNGHRNGGSVVYPPAHMEVGSVGVDLSDLEGARLQGRLRELDARLLHARGEKHREPLEHERERVLGRLRDIRDAARARRNGTKVVEPEPVRRPLELEDGT